MLSKKSNEKDYKKLIRDLSEITSKNVRGDVYFRSSDEKIEYYKLIQMTGSDKSRYYSSLDRGFFYPEWAFEFFKHRFNHRETTRINIDDTKFLNDALLQVQNSIGVRVLEERFLGNTSLKVENLLQYLKIVSNDGSGKEYSLLYEGDPFTYANGKRFDLSRIKEVQELAANTNGFVVKVTEELLI